MSAVVRRNAWEIKTSFYFLSPMKFLSNVLKALSTLILHDISKCFIHQSIYGLFYNSPRKIKIETTGVSVK